MKPTELKHWPEICKHLQEEGYVAHNGDMTILYDPKTGHARYAALGVATRWGNTQSVNITPFLDPSDIKPLSPAPPPANFVPLDCK